MFLKMLVFLAVVCLVQDSAEAQRRRGPGGGGGPGGGATQRMGSEGERAGQRLQMQAMRLLPAAKIWAEISFKMDLSQDTLTALKDILSAAYEERIELLKEAKEEDTWAYAKAQLQKREREVIRKVEKHLTRRQSRQLDRALRSR